MRTLLIVGFLLCPAVGHAQHAPRSWLPVQPPAMADGAGAYLAAQGAHARGTADGNAPASTALMADAAAAQEPGRHTRTGLIVGAIAGTAVGFGIGTFIRLMCESEQDDCDGVATAITVLGTVSGAVAGAIIGAAIPRSRDPAATPTEVPARSRVGSASISLGAGAFELEDWTGAHTRGNGIAARANVYAELKPWLALGPEIGIVRGGSAGDVRHGALAVRSTLHRGQVSPYIAGNLGAYQSTGVSLEYLGGAVALGSRFSRQADSRFFLDVEGRYARHAQNIDPMRAAVLSLGAGTYW